MRRKEKHCLNILEPQGDLFDNSTKCDASKQVWRMESCTVKCIGEFTSKGSQPKGCWMSVARIEVLSSWRIWRDTLKEEEDKSGWLVNNSWERSSADKWTHWHCTFGPQALGFFLLQKLHLNFSTKAHIIYSLFLVWTVNINKRALQSYIREAISLKIKSLSFIWNLIMKDENFESFKLFLWVPQYSAAFLFGHLVFFWLGGPFSFCDVWHKQWREPCVTNQLFLFKF